MRDKKEKQEGLKNILLPGLQKKEGLKEFSDPVLEAKSPTLHQRLNQRMGRE